MFFVKLTVKFAIDAYINITYYIWVRYTNLDKKKILNLFFKPIFILN